MFPTEWKMALFSHQTSTTFLPKYLMKIKIIEPRSFSGIKRQKDLGKTKRTFVFRKQ